MSRSGYSDDYESEYSNAVWLYMRTVRNAIGGKRGRAFLTEMATAMDAMPKKRLIADYLSDERGEVCAIGAVGKARGIDMSKIDADDPEQVGRVFGIPRCLAAEIEWINDDDFAYHFGETPEKRWQRVRRWVQDNLDKPGTCSV